MDVRRSLMRRRALDWRSSYMVRLAARAARHHVSHMDAWGEERPRAPLSRSHRNRASHGVVPAIAIGLGIRPRDP
eukprot:scaffold1629_cov369-Prasinococcus_capsulatus_cf.AAC.33